MLYRFGARTFTTSDVASIGYRHGIDGIMFYPPIQWVDRPVNPFPAELTDAYRNAYRAGRANSYVRSTDS